MYFLNCSSRAEDSFCKRTKENICATPDPALHAVLGKHKALLFLSFADEPRLHLRAVKHHHPSVSQEGVDGVRLQAKPKKRV